MIDANKQLYRDGNYYVQYPKKPLNVFLPVKKAVLDIFSIMSVCSLQPTSQTVRIFHNGENASQPENLTKNSFLFHRKFVTDCKL